MVEGEEEQEEVEETATASLPLKTRNTVECSKCGFRNPENLKFCGNCGRRMEEEEEAPRPPSTIKCGKCGFRNPRNLKFCGNCGTRIRSAWLGSDFLATRFEALALLHLTGSIYLLISLMVNALVQATYLFYFPYISSALLGLYAGNGFLKGQISGRLKAASLTAALVGLVSTFLLFIVGLEVRGVVGPAWAIFAITLLFYVRARDRLVV